MKFLILIKSSRLNCLFRTYYYLFDELIIKYPLSKYLIVDDKDDLINLLKSYPDYLIIYFNQYFYIDSFINPISKDYLSKRYIIKLYCEKTSHEINFDKNIFTPNLIISSFDKDSFNPINDKVFYDKNIKRDIDISIIGKIDDNYPLRTKLLEMIDKNYFKGINLYVKEHPGYWNLKDPNKELEDYSTLLNRSKMVFNCSSRYQYTLTKYQEIPACKALMIADRPLDNPYQINFIEISSNDSYEYIYEKTIESLLLYNKGFYNNIIKDNYNKVFEDYSIKKYIDKMIKQISL